MKEKQNSPKRNYYKISTFLLATFLVLIFLIYFISEYSSSLEDKAYTQAKQDNLNEIISFVQNNNYLELVNSQSNESLVLVPYESLFLAQQEVMKEIVSQISSQGFVVIEDNSTQLILVPYQGELVQES